MKNFHTYGDSHATHHGGWSSIQIEGLKIITQHLGPKLAFSFGRDKNIVVNKKIIKKGDYICFCMGEIDCRAHINKYKENWKKNVDNLVIEYFKAIEKNVRGLDSNTCVYNVVPQLERSLKKFQWIKRWEEQDPVNRSTLGTDEERKEYTVYMNQKLEEYCQKYGYIFFDVYNKYIDEKGFLNEMYHDNNCHIRDPIFIKEKLIEILK